MDNFEEIDLTEVVECNPPDERPPIWRRDWLAGWRWTVARVQTGQIKIAAGITQVTTKTKWLLSLPVRLAVWVMAIPGRIVRGIIHLPWSAMMTVRRGFVFGALSGFSVMTSALWALSSLPY